jgi:hypothetical protein
MSHNEGHSEIERGRVTRAGFASKLWKKLVSDPHFFDSNLLLDTAIALYGEALRCYEIEAYIATAILCRDALEACVHLVLSRKRRRESEYEIQTAYAGHSWRALKDHALEDPILRDRLNEIERVREKGNFAAHLSQKVDRRIAEEMKRISSGMESRPMSFRITRREAENCLEKTYNILVFMMERTAASGDSGA